jgi:hypothetical protein
MTRWIRTTALALVAALTAASTGGCLVTRVVEVRAQVCDFEQHFDIDLEHSASIRFREPVLSAGDIRWLTGTSPTRVQESATGVSMIYEIEKVGTPAGAPADFWVALDFGHTEDGQRLERLRFDPALLALLDKEPPDPETLAAVARNACDSPPSLWARSFELRLTEENLDALPSRDELRSRLGAPSVEDAASGLVEYAYRFRSPDPEPAIARTAIWYDASGTRPLRMESEYSRYSGAADFEARTLTMNIDL